MDEETTYVGTTISQEVKEKLDARVKQLGLNTANYLRFLIMKDLETQKAA